MLIKQILVILLSLILSGCSENDNPLIEEYNQFLHTTLNFTGSEDNLDIITWNIENFPKNSLTIDYVKECIDSLNVDIIALQEISNSYSFNELVNELSSTCLSGGNCWDGFRSGSINSQYGELSFLINTDQISSYQNPYTILYQEESYYFAYREPYVLKFNYNGQNITLINIHYKCCDGSEDRREQASLLLHNYITTNMANEKVIIVGDYNDELIDDNNVFDIFINDNSFSFTDLDIAAGSSAFWSFPGWPSHIDHILITSELFNYEIETATVLIDNSMNGYFSTYNEYISDHRPVGISLNILPLIGNR